MEEDSSADIIATDLGLETTMSNNCADQESTTGVFVITPAEKGHKLQTRACGWWKGSEKAKEFICVVQADIKLRLASLRRAENLQKCRRKKQQKSSQFFKDPFKFLTSFFTREKSGTLKLTKKDLADHLKMMHYDPRRRKQLSVPPDILQINSPEHQMEIHPPTLKEVESVDHNARSASAPGPNGVPYKMYKNAPDVLNFLWRLMRMVWQEKIIPKVWCREGGVLISKYKDLENISQF